MGKEERVINDRLQKLIEGMEKVGYNNYMIGLAEEVVNELQQRGVYCVDRFIQKLFGRINENENEGYLDILREGRTAVILARNKFSEVQIEFSERGPDLKADYNKCTVYFEVTRSRPNEDDKQVQSGAAFVSPKSIENIIAKIQGKLRQLKSGEINIVVIWSDTVTLLPPDIKEAIKCIQQEICQNPGVYKDLSGVLYTESGEAKYPKNFVLFKNDNASKPLGTCLTKKLQSLK